MQELAVNEIEQVSGGAANWGEAGAGAAFVGLSIAIVSGPIGWVGLGAAAGFAYFGGTLIGSGLSGNDVWQLDAR
ncbi:hypothetical protein [Shewanella chilikensis]|uniref:hypothetical protein n=1 Tax=Shewanella chilikensis TaxID=558541 RepID=UPI00399AE88D